MRRRAACITIAAALALAGCHSRERAIAELDARLNAETTRLERDLRALDRAKLPEDVAGLTKGFEESLPRIRATRSPMLRLYRMRDTFIGIETLRFFAENRKAGEDLALLGKLAGRPPTQADGTSAVLLYRALVEQAENRGRVLRRASVPYGKISDPSWGGLYYLGEAEGNLRFAKFVASLPEGVTEAEEPRADHQHLVAAANRLERESLALFESDTTGRSAIRPSAKLKEARELLAAKLDDGAVLALVETRLALQKKRAGETLPALLQMFAKRGPAATAMAASRSVKVTLVRWPYT